MAEIWRVTDWRLPAAIGPVYDSLIGAIGSDEFGATIRHCVGMLTSAALQAYAALTTSADTGAVRDVTQVQR